MDIITGFPAYFKDFLHHLDHFHMIQGAVIALFFGVATASIAGVIIVPIIAALVYIAADAVIPPLMNHTTIMMPTFDTALLKEGIALYVAFLLAIAIVFAIKKVVLSIRG
jgi:hypothetical protein